MVGDADQVCWSVYNDLDVERHNLPKGTVGIGLGVEVRQTAWAYAREGALANIVFIKFEIFNEGPYDLEDMFISLWSDPDLGDAGDDLVGSDDTLSLGYCYNEGSDANYGSAPPATGYDFFQGPLLFTGDMVNDSGKAWDTTWQFGYVNMPMSSFMIWVNPEGPEVPAESYNFMNGLKKNGSPMINPETDLESKFFGNGNPVDGSGWLDANSADRRFMQSTGPFSFAQGDSTEIVAAILVGQGSSPTNSITVLKNIDAFAQKVFNNNFVLPDPPAKPKVTVTNLTGKIVLSWGEDSEINNGDFPFEGYALMQGASQNGPWTDTLMWADLINDVAGVIDYRFSSAAGGDLPYVAKPGGDLGLQRVLITTRDVTGGGGLVNYSPYYYRVEAYSVDTTQPSGEKTLTSATVVTAMPHPPLTGTDITSATGDTLAWTHSAGGSDGSVSIWVVDPAAVTGDDYKVTFDDVGWYVIDPSTSDTLVEQWTNQGADGPDDYPVVEGLFVTVAGPEFGVTAIGEVAGASGAIDPADNVMWSLNSTGDWYVGSDDGSNFSRMNWRGLIGTADWEFRFTAGGSRSYEFGGDTLATDPVPFEIWNIGIGTPDDPSDDMRITPAYIDDDANGGWSYGDRNYPSEDEYVEPLPIEPVYSLWRIGRIQFNDASEATTAPAEGTIVRFTTAKINQPTDVFTFSSAGYEPSVATTGSENLLDNIKTVPNPYYLFSDYDASTDRRSLKFINLPAECSIDIYNLGGDLVRTVEKEDLAAAELTWDLLNASGVPVGSGIYIYVVDAPAFGQKIGKMAIFTEVELLDQY